MLFVKKDIQKPNRQERKMKCNYENEKREFDKDIVDVIGERLNLDRRGTNYWCLCPFHVSASRSLCVSRKQQMFYCFECKESGSLITFLQKYEGGYEVN